MRTLQGMFGSVDEEVIAMVLQSNGGHLEKTVENLLNMTGGAASEQSTASSRGNSSHSHSQTQTVLPDDFLRPPSYYVSIMNASYGRKSSMSQLESDAILAQMLQDELFMQELQANPHLFDNDLPVPPPRNQFAPSSSPSQPSYVPQASAASQQRSYPATSHASRGDFSGAGSNTSSVQSASFRDRWNSLTSSARAKLLAVANRLKPAAPAASDSYHAMNDERPTPSLPIGNDRSDIYRADDDDAEDYRPPSSGNVLTESLTDEHASAQSHRKVRKSSIN